MIDVLEVSVWREDGQSIQEYVVGKDGVFEIKFNEHDQSLMIYCGSHQVMITRENQACVARVKTLSGTFDTTFSDIR